MHLEQDGHGTALERHALTALRSAGRTRPMRAGDILFWEGQRSPRAFLVDSGTVLRTIATGRCELAIESVTAPGLVGAAEVTTHTPYTSTACAETDGTIVSIPGATFLRILDEDEPTRHYVLQVIGDELRAARRQLADRCGSTTLTRVARHLVDTVPDAGEWRPVVHTTQGELAEWVGTTRESAARALAELRARGLVTTGRGRIRIDDRDGLLELCSA